jgi:hypothetical protein
MPTHREARLKPEFAELYPPLEAGQWLSAAVASARMLLWQTRQRGATGLGQRTLDPRHFDFRGGVNDSSENRTRGTRLDDHGESDWPVRRQGRLRREFAELYPAVPAGVWVEASELGASLLHWIAGGGASPPLGVRLLPDEHFEFRGGELPRGSIGAPRTRREDTADGRGLAVG